MKVKITKSKYREFKVHDICDTDEGLIASSQDGFAYDLDELKGLECEVLKLTTDQELNPDEYCPDCFCTVKIEDWECVRADYVEITECPECGYRNKC